MPKIIISLLFIILVFTSCQKDPIDNLQEEPDENEIIIDPNPDPTLAPPPGFNPAYHENVIETQLAIFQLIITILTEAIKTPNLYYITGNNSAELRTGCPMPTLSGSTFPKTLTLDFDDGSGSCTNAGIPYEGSVTVVFSAALGDPGSQIQVTDMTGLVVNGYSFNLGGTIDMFFDTGLSYFYSINGGPLSSVLGDISTSVPDGASGSFTLGNDVNGDDVPYNPATYIDNAFDVSLDDAIITCENLTTGEVSMFCTDTADDIELQPQSCSCPISGVLRIKNNNGACFPPIDETNSVQYDFGDGTCTGESTELEQLIEFLSYEGCFTGTEGAANSIKSTDIGVQEFDFGDFATPIGQSLQLGGFGSESSDFTWTGPTAESPGMLNVGQTFTANPNSLLPWINEIHYDNAGPDVGEFVEIAGPAGLDLGCYELVYYDGGFGFGGGTIYATESLTGIIPDEGNGFGAIAFDEPFGGIQDGGGSFGFGGPDGIALVKTEKTHTLDFCE